MFIIDGVYRNVDISGLSAPILEGTVLTETGAIASADGSDAFGIVPQNIYEIPPTKLASVVVGGTIDLLSPANANVEFSEAVMKALGTDINFVQNSEAATEVPKPTSADAGKVVTVNEDGNGYKLAEGGGGGGAFVVRIDDETGVMDKTWNEIKTAIANCMPVVIPYQEPSGDGAYLTYIHYVLKPLASGSKYGVYTSPHTGQEVAYATCDNADGYPIVND